MCNFRQEIQKLKREVQEKLNNGRLKKARKGNLPLPIRFIYEDAVRTFFDKVPLLTPKELYILKKLREFDNYEEKIYEICENYDEYKKKFKLKPNFPTPKALLYILYNSQKED